MIVFELKELEFFGIAHNRIRQKLGYRSGHHDRNQLITISAINEEVTV